MANATINVEVRSNGEVVLGKLGAELEKVDKKAKGLKGTFADFAGEVQRGIGVGAGFSIATIAANKLLGGVSELRQSFRDLAAEAQHLSNVSRSTGLGVETVQKLSVAAQRSQTSFEQVTMAVAKLQKAIVFNTAETQRGLDALGLGQSLKGKSAQQQFELVAGALVKVGDATQRAAIATTLFGESGTKLLPFMDEYLKTGTEAVHLTKGQAEEMNRLQGALDDNEQAWKFLKDQLVSVVAEGLGATEQVQSTADAIKALAQAIRDSRAEITDFIGKLKLMAELAPGNMNAPGKVGGWGFSLGQIIGGGDLGAPGVKPPSIFSPQSAGQAWVPSAANEYGDPVQTAKVFALTESIIKGVSDDLKATKKETEKLVKDFKDQTADMAQASAAAGRGAGYVMGDMPTTGLVTPFGGIPQAHVYGKALEDALKRQQDLDKQFENTGARAVDLGMTLTGVAIVAGTLNDKYSQTVGVIENLQQSFKNAETGADKFAAVASAVAQIGGLIGGKAGGFLSGAAGGAMAGFGVGGPIGAIAGGLFGGIAGIFGASKQEKQQKAAQEAQKAAQEAQKAAEAAERAAQGLQTAIGGINTLIDNLTYQKDGNILQTFSDPSAAAAAAGLFGGTFWKTFREQGVAGIDALRPAWDKLHRQLIDLGFDPVKMGLGRIGQLFDVTNDPKTRALLGVSKGAGDVLKGALDAGYVDKQFLQDSTTIARQTLKELQGQGIDATTAAQMTADQLAALAQAYAATGQELPQDLQDAMAAAGIEVLPTQLEVLKESRDYLKQIAGREGYVGGGMVNAPQSGAWYPLHGREIIFPLDRPSKVGIMGGQGISVTINRQLGTTRETEYAFDRRVEKTMKRLLRQSPSVQREAKVAVNGGR